MHQVGADRDDAADREAGDQGLAHADQHVPADHRGDQRADGDFGLPADGGITALGTNIDLMGLVTVVVGYLVFRGLQTVLPKRLSLVVLALAGGVTLLVRRRGPQQESRDEREPVEHGGR